MMGFMRDDGAAFIGYPVRTFSSHHSRDNLDKHG